MLRVLILFLPVIFPSWRFFRAVEPSPRIEVLRGAEWVESYPRPERMPFVRQLRRLLWNPHWNRYLYSVSLSERLIIEPNAHSAEGLARIVRDREGKDLPWRITFVQEEEGQIVDRVEYESEGA